MMIYSVRGLTVTLLVLFNVSCGDTRAAQPPEDVNHFYLKVESRFVASEVYINGFPVKFDLEATTANHTLAINEYLLPGDNQFRIKVSKPQTGPFVESPPQSYSLMIFQADPNQEEVTPQTIVHTYSWNSELHRLPHSTEHSATILPIKRSALWQNARDIDHVKPSDVATMIGRINGAAKSLAGGDTVPAYELFKDKQVDKERAYNKPSGPALARLKKTLEQIARKPREAVELTEGNVSATILSNGKVVWLRRNPPYLGSSHGFILRQKENKERFIAVETFFVHDGNSWIVVR